MQFPLTQSNPSKSTRPIARVSVLVALSLSATFAPHDAQSQSRRARTSAKAPASSQAVKVRTLEARLRKATAIYNSLGEVVNGQALFMVQGTIERGDTSRLLVYGQSFGRNDAASRSLGQNNQERFLTVHNPEPERIINGRYEGECIALSQTDFAPVPARYRQAETAFYSYRGIVISLQNEIEFEKQSGTRAARAREKVRLARAKQDKARQEKAQAARRESVYRARVALAEQETAAKIAQLDGFVATTSDKDGAYLQSSAAAMALFNKWGGLGVANRTLLWRAFDDLASAAASQVESGDWKSATQTAEKLMTLELFEKTPGDAQTGKKRIELGVDAKDLRLPSTAVGLTMHREGQEPAAAAHLAQAWLSKLPTYIVGPATREEKLRVAKLSQLLGANVFALLPQRMQTVALAVDAVRGAYGPGSLSVLAEYEGPVEAAKRERVARQVAAFNQVGAANAPVEKAQVARTFGDVPPETATANAPQAPTTPAEQPVQKPVEKPLPKPLVPAVDFTMRSFINAKKVRLSDFRGKTVILYFWNALWMEDHDVSPTPAEQLFALSKGYDPRKVVFLLVNENGFADETAKQYRKITDPTPDAGRDQERGYGPRLYPEVSYSLETSESAGDIPTERVVSEAALVFYTGNKNPSANAMRVTVINPAGQVVGSVDFKEDQTASLFNNNKQRGQGQRTYVVYDFDEATLEDLLARAMAPQP